MARKNTVTYQIATNQSLGADFTTNPTVITYMDNCSYQINVTTSNSTGSFAIQGSNDYVPVDGTNGPANSGTWNTLPLSDDSGTVINPAAAGANSSFLLDLNQVPFTAVKVVYTHNVAGTGTCNIYFVSKQLGG